MNLGMAMTTEQESCDLLVQRCPKLTGRCGSMSINTKRSRRPTKKEQRAETTEQILDAAEALFSKHGLYGVTLKDVAKCVGVHHTLVNYYFQDKKQLFDAVFARR